MSLKKLQEGSWIKWCGYILQVIDTEGPVLIEPDADRMKAVTKFPTPKNRTELLCFLGLKTQIQSWIPGLNWICKELHQLMSEMTAWYWMETHKAEFQNTKAAITRMITLISYDQSRDTSVITDGSSEGLGFLVYQSSKEDERVRMVQIGSTGLTQRHRLCSPIELESMVIQYMLKKAERYLWACPLFHIYMDCKSIPTCSQDAINIKNI